MTIRFNDPIPMTLGAWDAVPQRSFHTPAVSHDTLLEMAQEKVTDADTFTDWLCGETLFPAERRPSAYFAPITTHALLVEVLLNPKATAEQLAEAARELRRRFLEDHKPAVDLEFGRLVSEEVSL